MEFSYRGRYDKELFDGTAELNKLYSVKPVELKRMDEVIFMRIVIQIQN